MNRLQFIATLLCIPKGIKELVNKYQKKQEQELLRLDRERIAKEFGISNKQLELFDKFAISRRQVEKDINNWIIKGEDILLALSKNDRQRLK